MRDSLFIISTRQLGQLNYEADLIQEHRLVLIASDSELENLEPSLRSHFDDVIEVPVAVNDGVIVTYDLEVLGSRILQSSHLTPSSSIVCFDEGNTSLAHSLRRRFKLGDEKFDTPDIELFRNKVAMKNKLAEAGIQIPQFSSFHEEVLPYAYYAEQLGCPFVFKPSESAGSNGVYIIENEHDFTNAKDAVKDALNLYEAETYISGKLYHCDIALFGGETVFAECTEYLAPTIDFQTGTPLGGKIMGEGCDLRRRLIRFTEQSLRALNAGNGVYHTEVFVTLNGELVFLESGARPPGMLVTRMYEKATGVNLLNLDVEIQVGRLLERKTQGMLDAFYLVYPKGVGKVNALYPLPALANMDTEFKRVSNIGDVHDGCSSNLDFTAYVICSGSDTSFETAYQSMANYSPLSYVA
ncbi:ATP-grasp domain-containing protein [Vibrio penaeicida]|uniref:ATP-grasp domain-containing protein n=1 Tax=Vibrio penaeicida TaxID=104609 RepID=A0AAV5NZE3_9VIBR|nr:ATP-grasp domain-containing protein [Vibrio penaeicida]RTZ23973.1 ATP-grasp domain-containing protein [Vibrio penaeicida]GLQ75830.1 hypothetical protein GCM10007932_51930 [Vibrio penaeicida]